LSYRPRSAPKRCSLD